MKTRQVSGRDRQRYSYRPAGRPAPAPAPVLTRRQKRLVAYVAAALLAVILLLNVFAVTEITVQGVSAKLQAQVGQEVQDAVKSRWNWGNLITLSGSNLAQAVLVKDYELKSVTVQRHWPHGLDVTAAEKQPALIWATGGSRYLLDIDGTIIGPPGEGSSKLPLVTDTSNVPVKVGDRAVPAQFVQFCEGVLATLPRQAGAAVAGFSISDTTTDVQVALVGRPYVLKFDTTRDASGQLADLQAVLAELAKQKKTPTQYIDLRIENKVYYK